MRSNRYWAAPVLAAAAAAVLAACGSSASPGATSTNSPATQPQANSSSSASTSTSGTVISTRSTKLGTVLVNAQGHTLYWFAKDTSTTSNCSGTCATYWPPVLGKPTAASGASLTKPFGSITRSGGQLQATYDGHPLYTYAADSSAGMTSGNGLNLSGALWWAMTPTGATLSGHPTSSTSSSSSGGGYGY